MAEHEHVVLAEGITASDGTLKNLAEALSSAQMEYEAARKTAENKFENFHYVDLDGLLAAARKSLHNHKLATLQYHSVDLLEKSVTVFTRLIHWESGEWIEHAITLPAEGVAGKGDGGESKTKFNQKTIGAAITYGRKYSFKTLVGLADASDEDVDKEQGSGDLSRRRSTPPPPRPAPKAEVIPPTPAARRTQADQNTAAADADRIINTAERRALFEECYTYGANTDHVMKGVYIVTGQESTKTVRLSQLEKIKAEVYKLANPQTTEEVPADVLAAIAGDEEVKP